MPAGDLGLDAAQLREHVIRPVLLYLNLHSSAAENLVLGTAMVESRIDYLKQIGRGPALGIYQMEPATHDDIWTHFLSRQPGLGSRIESLLGAWPDRSRQLVTNLAYATAMCRAHYYRVKEALPAADDTAAQAVYYKKYYNTPAGAATVGDYATAYRPVVLGRG